MSVGRRVEEASLDEGYRACRALHRRHGTTFYWATALLPSAKRRHVHALYGFCRYADEIVDSLGPVPVEVRVKALGELRDELFAAYDWPVDCHPVVRAVTHTARQFGIDRECFSRFLDSMAMDFTVSGYASFEDLLVYMDGSAAVIGEMMLPILDPLDPAAFGPARELGIAFQLTNFLRDVGEDYRRGRVYLPEADLAHFGAQEALVEGRVDAAWRELMAFEIERNRGYYCGADVGIAMLPPFSSRCITGARHLYSRILERIEAADYDVFSSRVRVPTARKMAVAARLLTPSIPSASA